MVTDQEHPDFPNIFAQEKESNERSSSTKSANTLARMLLVAQAETLKVDRDTGSKPIVHSQRQWNNRFVKIPSNGSVNENEGQDRAVLKVLMPTCKPARKENAGTQEKWTLMMMTIDNPSPGIVMLVIRNLTLVILLVPWPVVAGFLLLLLPQDILRNPLIRLVHTPSLQPASNQHIMAQKESPGQLLQAVQARLRQSTDPVSQDPMFSQEDIHPGQDHQYRPLYRLPMILDAT
jgi:hypothetical protein